MYHLTPKGKYKLNFTEEKSGVWRGETNANWRDSYDHNLILPGTKASTLSLKWDEVNANSQVSKPLLQFLASIKKNTWKQWV